MTRVLKSDVGQPSIRDWSRSYLRVPHSVYNKNQIKESASQLCLVHVVGKLSLVVYIVVIIIAAYPSLSPKNRANTIY